MFKLLKKWFWDIWFEQKPEPKPPSAAQIAFIERLAKIKQQEEEK